MLTLLLILFQIMTTVLLTILFPLYVLFIIWANNKSIPHSISDSWYILGSKKPILKYLFTVWCYVIGALILSYSSDDSFLYFLGGMGMFWVGTYTYFKIKKTENEYIHFAGAALTILSCLVALAISKIYFPLIVMVIGTPITYLLTKKNKTHIFWVEILAFACIIIGLWLK